MSRTLTFIDNIGRKVHRFDPASGETRTWETPSIVTSLALRQSGGAIVTMRTGIHLLDFASGGFEPVWLAPEPPVFVFNDAKVDRHGRFVMGASTGGFKFEAPEANGGLYSLDADRRLTQLDSGIHISNSPCWSPDGTTLYFSDSWLKTIYAYDYDLTTGGVSNRRVFAQTESLGGTPDGATTDMQGRVWVAIYGAGLVAVFAPDGRLERRLELPARFVSSVTFGGERLDELYVTSIEHDVLGQASDEAAGYVYLVEGAGANGAAEPKFGG